MSKKLKKNVPVLRFPEFEEEWQSTVLDNLVEWHSGGTPAKDNLDYWNGDIPWITASSMYSDIIFDSEQKITKLGLSNGSRIAPKNSILILVRGSMLYNRIPMGIAGRDLSFNQDVKALKVLDADEVKFLFIWLKSKEYLLKSMVTGTGIGAGKLDTPQLKSLIVFKPYRKEQEKIASFLGTIDTRLTQLSRKRELLQTYKRGVMQKIFSQEVRFKGAIGADFSDWEEKKLGEIFDFYRGGLLSKSDLDNRGRNLCVHYGQLFTIYKEVIQRVESRTNIQNGFKSKVGDILMPSSDVTPIGLATASALLREDIFLGGDMNILRPKKTINSICMSYLLNFEKQKIIELVSGITVRHIYGKDLKKLTLCFPSSIEEQEKIADFLTAIDRKIETVSRSIGLVEQFKKGLLQKMFV